MNSLYHNLDAYNNVNVYLICSFNDDSINLTNVFDNIYNFYIKTDEQYIIEPRKDQDKMVINHNLEEAKMNSVNPKDKNELKNYKVKKIINLYGFISNSLPFSNFELNFGNIQFDYIVSYFYFFLKFYFNFKFILNLKDISYTGIRKISFKESVSLDSVQTLILAYNQLENDLDENINLPIKMTRLAIELNKLKNLKVLILKGKLFFNF